MVCRFLIIVLLALCSIAPATHAQTDPDDILRTAEDGLSAALSWLKRQRDSVRADAHKKLEELRQAADNTTEGPTFRLAAPPEGDAPVQWREWTPASEAKLPDRLVILVHGLDEPGGIWDETVPAILDAGHPLARFDYANDQHVAQSANEFAGMLQALRAVGVERIDLVCHSMGGLVARDVLTREEYYRADATGGDRYPHVERLILVGTPNRGSAFAGLQRVSELREQFVRWIDSGGIDMKAAAGFLRDGRGEAAADLAYGSEFLTQLNARPLPKNVRISIIAGRLGDKGVAEAMELLDSPIARRFLDPDRIEQLKSAAASLQEDLGDGVVSVESALLPGVEDVVVLNANHRTLLRRVTVPGINLDLESTTPPAIQEIIDRLER